MKCDRRWWSDGRLEREQALHGAGYRPSADGSWRKPVRENGTSPFAAARAVRPKPAPFEWSERAQAWNWTEEEARQRESFDGALTFGIGLGFENRACEPLSPERLKRVVDDLRKPSAKDYAISIPVDLSCKCGSCPSRGLVGGRARTGRVEVHVPDATFAWGDGSFVRTRGGVVERSVDGGETWAREPGHVMPPSATEYATRVPGKWLLDEVDASVMHGSSPEHLARQIRQVPGVVDAFLDGLRVGKREPAQGSAQPRFDKVPPAVIDARLDLLRHSAGSVNATLRRDESGRLRLSARIPAPHAIPHALLDRFATVEEVKRAAGSLVGGALDLWGAVLDCKRAPCEPDDSYRQGLFDAYMDKRDAGEFG